MRLRDELDAMVLYENEPPMDSHQSSPAGAPYVLFRYDMRYVASLLKEACPSLYAWKDEKGKIAAAEHRGREVSELEELLGGLLSFKAKDRTTALDMQECAFIAARHRGGP